MGGMALTTLGSDDAVNIWWSNASVKPLSYFRSKFHPFLYRPVNNRFWQTLGRVGNNMEEFGNNIKERTDKVCFSVTILTTVVAAAEHGIALIASMARNVPQASASMKAGMWILKTLFPLTILFPFFTRRFLLSLSLWQVCLSLFSEYLQNLCKPPANIVTSWRSR